MQKSENLWNTHPAVDDAVEALFVDAPGASWDTLASQPVSALKRPTSYDEPDVREVALGPFEDLDALVNALSDGPTR